MESKFQISLARALAPEMTWHQGLKAPFNLVIRGGGGAESPALQEIWAPFVQGRATKLWNEIPLPRERVARSAG
jgi:hypothetical protein